MVLGIGFIEALASNSATAQKSAVQELALNNSIGISHMIEVSNTTKKIAGWTVFIGGAVLLIIGAPIVAPVGAAALIMLQLML